MLKLIRNILAVCFLGFSIIACKGKETDIQKETDFSLIKSNGELTALTLSSSTSYFIYKGKPMGYEYELLKNFADIYGLKLNIKIAANKTQLIEMLEAGEGDLIAYDIPITNELKQQLIYCGKESVNEQVLIQQANSKDTILNDVTEMIGKEIWVGKESKYYNRLNNLNHELGGGIIIKEVETDTLSVEDLIEMVSLGKIPYTVSDKDVALLNKTYFHNINVRLQISHPQRSSWVVRKTCPELANTLNA